MTVIELTQQELFDVKFILLRRVDQVEHNLTKTDDDEYWKDELRSAQELREKFDKAIKVTLTSL